MKLLFVFFLIFLASTLSVTEEKYEEKHEEPITIALAAVGAAITLGKYLQSSFAVTCGKGYSRGVNINILNNLPNTTISSLGHYEYAGKVLEFGKQDLPPNHYSKYYFTRKLWFGGASGLTAWKLSPSDALIIYYYNPSNSWNYQGACVETNQNLPDEMYDPLPMDSLKARFNKLYYAHKKWPSNCKEFDNTESQDDSWFDKGILFVGQYKIDMAAKYQYNGDSTISCYIAELNVVVRKR